MPGGHDAKRKGEKLLLGRRHAIRRSIFEQSESWNEWKNSVSDDYSLTRALERKNHPILFLPECLTLSYCETDFDGLLEFTNRQILITRVLRDKVWARAAATHFSLLPDSRVGRSPHPGQSPCAKASLSSRDAHISADAALRHPGSIRLIGCDGSGPAARSQITGQAWIYVLLTVFIPFLYLVNFANSLITQKNSLARCELQLISSEQTRIG